MGNAMSTEIHPAIPTPAGSINFDAVNTWSVPVQTPAPVEVPAPASATDAQPIETPPPSPNVTSANQVPCYLWLHRVRGRDTLYLYESIQDAYASALSRHTRIHDDPGDIIWNTPVDNILNDIATDSFTHTDNRTTNLAERVWYVSNSPNLQLSIGLGTDLPRNQSAQFCGHGYETFDTNPEYADMPPLISLPIHEYEYAHAMPGLINMTPSMASTLAFVQTQVAVQGHAASQINVSPVPADVEDTEPPSLIPLYSLNNTHVPNYIPIQRRAQVADINGVD
jgi:hypothetical protein